MNFKKTAICAAVAAAVGVPGSASALVYNLTYDGWYTLLNPSGTSALNNGDFSGPPMYGDRTPVTGTMAYDTTTGTGTGTMGSYSFFGGGLDAATGISFAAIGDGAGGSGPLILANMGFDWTGNVGIPVSIVLDASGFFAAIENAGGGASLAPSSIITGGVTSATEGFLFGAKASYTLPMGAVPMAATTFNTTAIGTVTLGTNPSGTLPLFDDGIGGSPMLSGPFPGFNRNYDITTIHVESIIPVPAAVWLFGSGLIGLAGVARRRKH